MSRQVVGHRGVDNDLSDRFPHATSLPMLDIAAIWRSSVGYSLNPDPSQQSSTSTPSHLAGTGTFGQFDALSDGRQRRFVSALSVMPFANPTIRHDWVFLPGLHSR